VATSIERRELPSQVALNAGAPWRKLSAKQQTWVKNFMRTGDSYLATRAAYPDAKPKSIATMRFFMLRSPRILAAIVFWNTLVVQKTALPLSANESGLVIASLWRRIKKQIRSAESAEVTA
jgi:hypothetical protein